MKFGITVHTIIKNEEKFIKYALLSVLRFVDQILVYDTGSGDKTLEIIARLKSNKIILKKYDHVDREKLVYLRNQQIKETKTPWIMILDGDEIWPENNLQKMLSACRQAKSKIQGLVCKTRNCVGDIYHYLPENKGRYRIGSWTGHLNIRFLKKTPDLQVLGRYPQESYNYAGISIQNQLDKLEFVDTWYLHATHLKRSNWAGQITTIDRLKKFKFWGKTCVMPKIDLPEIFYTN